MRFKATVDDTGKAKELSLDGLDIKSNTSAFEVKAAIGEITVVNLTLILVDVELDLANVEGEMQP